MSATNRGSEREPRDFYSTPREAFELLLPAISVAVKCAIKDGRTGEVWEPASGDGRLVDWMNGVQIKASGDDLSSGYDFLKDGCLRSVIVTNPPFSLAQQFCHHAIEHADHIFMLLRLPFLASAVRRDWWREHEPQSLFVLSERPSFAMFVKCESGKRNQDLTRACDYRTTLPSDAERPSKCPNCGGAVRVTTTDATDYAWFYWGTAHKGIHFL